MTRIINPRGPGRPRTAPPPPISHAKTAAAEEPAVENDGDDVPAGPGPVDALSEMMAGLRGADNSRVVIYRVVKNQPPSYVGECDPASFSLDDLRDKYRGGAFRLYIMKEGKLWKNMPVYVEPPPVGHEPAQASSGMADVLAVMRDGFAAQVAAVRELAAAPRVAPSPFSGMDLPAVITAVAAAITALRPPPAPPAPPPPPDRGVDMLIEGIRLASELREGAAPADNSIGGMLRTVLTSPLMAQAVQAAATPPAPPKPQPRPQGAAPALPAPTPPAQPAPAPAGSDMNMLHYYYGVLCQKAASGADPTLYAELVLDNVDDETLNTLLTKQPTPLDALIAEYPPAAVHRDWFAALIDTLMQAMSGDETPEPGGEPVAQPVHVNGSNGAADAPHALSPIVPGQPS